MSQVDFTQYKKTLEQFADEARMEMPDLDGPALHKLAWERKQDQERTLEKERQDIIKRVEESLATHIIQLDGVIEILNPKERVSELPFYLHRDEYFSVTSSSEDMLSQDYGKVLLGIIMKNAKAPYIVERDASDFKEIKVGKHSTMIEEFFQEMIYLFGLKKLDGQMTKFSKTTTEVITRAARTMAEKNFRPNFSSSEITELQRETGLKADQLIFKQFLYCVKLIFFFAREEGQGVKDLLRLAKDGSIKGIKIAPIIKSINVYPMYRYSQVLSPIERERLTKYWGGRDLIALHIKAERKWHDKPTLEHEKELKTLSKEIAKIPQQLKSVIHGRINEFKRLLSSGHPMMKGSKTPTYKNFISALNDENKVDMLDEITFIACLYETVNSPKALAGTSYLTKFDRVRGVTYYDAQDLCRETYMSSLFLRKTDQCTVAEVELRNFAITKCVGDIRSAIENLKAMSSL